MIHVIIGMHFSIFVLHSTVKARSPSRQLEKLSAEREEEEEDIGWPKTTQTETRKTLNGPGILSLCVLYVLNIICSGLALRYTLYTH